MKTINKIKTKNIKPISYDAHYQYRCPDIKCGFTHWLSLKEVQTKNFKIVCDCGVVFSPKRIKKNKIIYYKPNIEKEIQTKEAPDKKSQQDIPTDILEKSSDALVKYGFSKTESKILINKAFAEQPTTDIIELIKLALTKIGE